MARKVLLKDVAKAAGVSVFTASMALRDHPRTSAAARERVKEEAARLGYERDLVGAMLASRRSGGGTSAVPEVCVLQSQPGGEVWMAEAERAGMRASVVVTSKQTPPGAVSRMLWARGIAGLVVGNLSPWEAEARGEFAWDRFSVVRTHRGYPDLPFHVVRHSAFDYMSRTLREVFARGYRRVATILMRTPSVDDDEARFGAILNIQGRWLPPGAELLWRETPARLPYELDDETLGWVRACAPDAILAYHWTMVYPLERAGWKFPGPTGLAAVMAEEEPGPGLPEVSGCASRARDTAAQGLAILRDLIARGERGFPELEMQRVLEPQWVEGATLPRR